MRLLLFIGITIIFPVLRHEQAFFWTYPTVSNPCIVQHAVCKGESSSFINKISIIFFTGKVDLLLKSSGVLTAKADKKIKL